MVLRYVVVSTMCGVVTASAQPAPAPAVPAPSPAGAPAANEQIELVTRTSGVVRGTVLERSATAYTVQTADGTQIAVPYSDVLEAHPIAPPPAPAPAPPPAQIEKAQPMIAPEPPPIDKAQPIAAEEPPAPRHGRTRLSFASGIGVLGAQYRGTGMFSTPPSHYDGTGTLTFATAAVDVGFNAGPATIGAGFTVGRDVGDGDCAMFGLDANLLVAAGPVVYFGVDGGVLAVNDHCDFNGSLTSSGEGSASSGGAGTGDVELGIETATVLAVRVGGRGGLRFPVGPKAYLAVEVRLGVNVATLETGEVAIYPMNGGSDHATVENLTLFDGALMFAGGFNL